MFCFGPDFGVILCFLFDVWWFGCIFTFHFLPCFLVSFSLYIQRSSWLCFQSSYFFPVLDSAFHCHYNTDNILLNALNRLHIHGLVQEKCNSSALAMELCLSFTDPSTYGLSFVSSKSGAHFTNDFSIVIQLRWKFLFGSLPSCNEVIAMKFCIWHDDDSYAGVACAKFCSDMIPSIEFELRCKNRWWNGRLVYVLL